MTLKEKKIIERLAVFTDEFGHLPCNEYPNWRWWQKLLDVWGENSSIEHKEGNK